MKRCPTCNRVESDDALVFCPDGTALISDSGPVSADAGTMKFGSAPVSGEIETSVLPPTSTTPEINRPTAPTTITEKLQLKLSGEGEQKLAKKYTDSNEAYQLFLIGQF